MSLDIQKGDRFTKLTVLKEVDRFVQPSGQTQRGLLCICDCGKEKRVRLSHLIHQRVRSCGCLINEWHGYTGTHLHNIWRGMRNRVSPNYFEKQYYFDKGIDMYSGWSKFPIFKEWALLNGYHKSLEIDRRENSKGYHPYNCRFVTREQNLANRDCTFMISYKGKDIAFMTVLRDTDKMPHMAAIRCRIKRGWNHDKAIDTPIRKGNYHRR